MQPVLLEVGRFKLYSFGSFIALGALLGGILMYHLAAMRKIKTKFLFDVILYSLVAALLGARIGYYFTYKDQFQSFWQMFYFWQGGLLALAGLVVGFLVFIYQLKKLKLPQWQMLDIAGLGFLLGWGIGKFGCHLSSCSAGKPSTAFFSINGALPVDLFSTIFAIIACGVLVYVWTKNKLSDGVVFFLAMEGFFLGELLIKTLKTDFGEGIVRVEALIYLGLIVAIYILFYRLHGPKIEKNRVGLFFKNLVFRKRN